MTALCQLTGLSRASFYRSQLLRQAVPVEMEIRDELQQVALESPAYGYRRITAELRRRGFLVNHKRVLRMMRQDNLLCVRRRPFVLTTDSHHPLPIYPNLARQIQPTAINQLWAADITYMILDLVTNDTTEFAYELLTLLDRRLGIACLAPALAMNLRHENNHPDQNTNPPGLRRSPFFVRNKWLHKDLAIRPILQSKA